MVLFVMILFWCYQWTKNPYLQCSISFPSHSNWMLKYLLVLVFGSSCFVFHVMDRGSHLLWCIFIQTGAFQHTNPFIIFPARVSTKCWFINKIPHHLFCKHFISDQILFIQHINYRFYLIIHFSQFTVSFQSGKNAIFNEIMQYFKVANVT